MACASWRRPSKSLALRDKEKGGVETSIACAGVNPSPGENAFGAYKDRSPRLLFDAARRNPEHPRRRYGINCLPLPPGDFVAAAVIVTVMGSAWRYGEFVADLAPHEPQPEQRMNSLARAPLRNSERARCRK
jgi:hypothetical protein